MSVGLEVIDLYSRSNGRRLAVWLWTPSTPGPHPVLLLLHGVHDAGGHGWWVNGHAPQAVASMAPADSSPVVVMPSDTGAERGSAWCDWSDGTTRAETFVVEELLPCLVRERDTTDTRWVTGLSMGGYGALLLALRHPGLFASATSMSGYFHPLGLDHFVPGFSHRIWAVESQLAAHDITALALDPDRRAGLRFAFDCGADDDMLGVNRQFHELLAARGIEHGYAEHPGDHTWDFWRARLPEHIAFHQRHPSPLSGRERDAPLRTR